MKSVTQTLAQKHGIKATAPFCGKKSFSIKDDDSAGKCSHSECGKSIVAREEKVDTHPLKKRSSVQPGGCTLEAYSAMKQLPQKFLQELGVQQRQYQGAPAVAIPYYDEHHEEQALRYRIEQKKRKDVDNRFRWRKRSKPFLYGLWKLDEARKAGYVVLVDGESDTQTLWFHNIPALGLPGAKTWKEDWNSFFDGIDKVYIVIEPDSGGVALHGWLSTSRLRERAFLVDMGQYEDPSNLHCEHRETFTEMFQAHLSAAIPWSTFKEKYDIKRKHQAWEQCRNIAEHEHILDLFYQNLLRCKFVGEEKAAKLVFLALCSRVLQAPVSVTIKGPSSAGKSYVVKKVVKFFPETAYYALTGMSDKLLIYSSQNFEHRFIIIYEAEGIQGDFASYLIRTLISEQCIKYDTLQSTKNGYEEVHLEKKGPTGFILTTTKIRLHPENETRILSITVNDSREHTKEILRSMAKEQPDIQYEAWHALQTWLEYSNLPVDIPFAADLAECMNPADVRLRRDFAHILSFIQVHALLHQTHRETIEGRIQATYKDYAVVRELVLDIVSEGIGLAVSETVRDTVNAVAALMRSPEDTVTIKMVAERLSLDESAAYRRVRAAMEKGYLKNLEPRRGCPAKLQTAEPLPEDAELLPSVDALKACRVAGDSEGSDPVQSSGKRALRLEPFRISPEDLRVAEQIEARAKETDDAR